MDKPGKSFSKLRATYSKVEKKGVVADELGICDSYLTKLAAGENARRVCDVIDALGLELVDRDYVKALEAIVKAKL